VSAARGQ